MNRDLLAFAQENIDVYKGFKDYYNHFKGVDSKGRELTFDKTRTLDEKETIMTASFASEIERLSGMSKPKEIPLESWIMNPSVKWAAFAVTNIMIDTILPDSLIDSMGIYTDVITGDWGNNFAFDIEPRDLFVVTKAARGKRRSEAHKQFRGQVTVTPVEHDITVAVSLYRVLAGKESLAKFVTKAVQSIETQMTYDAFDAFNTAMSNLDNAGDDALRISGWSQGTATQLAQKVTAWNGGSKAIFLGTKVALANILPANTNFRYTLDSDYVKVGYIRDFCGFDVMELPQIANYKTPFTLKLDDNKIYVISPSSQKLIKMCIEGSTLAITDDIYANANLTQNATFKKSWGTGVATSSVAGCITLG